MALSSGGPAIQVTAKGGRLASLVQSSPPATIPPISGSWSVGDVLQSSAGHLWYCYKTGVGTTSAWAKLSGSLVVLPAAKRVYDSRTAGGPLTAGATRNVSVTTAVPAGASAVLINLTVTNTKGPGFLAVYSAGATYEGTSNLNYSAGQTIANNATTAVNAAGAITVRCTGAKSDFIVGVAGFYPLTAK